MILNRKELEPIDYTLSKIRATSVDILILMYKDYTIGNIPLEAIEKIKNSIKYISTKGTFTIFQVIELFSEKLLEEFHEDIIFGLQTIINVSNNQERVAQAKQMLYTNYSNDKIIKKQIQEISSKTNETIKYGDIKTQLLMSIGDYQRKNNISVTLINKIIISDLLKLNKNIDGKESRLTNIDIIHILGDIFKINPDFVSKNFLVKNIGFHISEELHELIKNSLKIKEITFNNLDYLSKKICVNPKELLDIIKYLGLYNITYKRLPIVNTKITTYSIKENVLLEYFGKTNVQKNIEK